MGNVSRRCAAFSLSDEDAQQMSFRDIEKPERVHLEDPRERRRPRQRHRSNRVYRSAHAHDTYPHDYSHHYSHDVTYQHPSTEATLYPPSYASHDPMTQLKHTTHTHFHSAPGSGTHTPNPLGATWSHASSPYLQQRSLENSEVYLTPARLVPTTYIPRKSPRTGDIEESNTTDECPRCGVTISAEECMCKKCWDEGGEEMRQVVRHHNHNHADCPNDYPESQIPFLPNQDELAIAHWRAEWRHAHGDHQLCRPEYMFGCTEIEQVQLLQVQRHMAGDHRLCPTEYPQYQLKADITGTGLYEADELSDENKRIWRAAWKHQHNVHDDCRWEYGYGCRLGERQIHHIHAATVSLNGTPVIPNGHHLIPPMTNVTPVPASPLAVANGVTINGIAHDISPRISPISSPASTTSTLADKLSTNPTTTTCSIPIST